MLQSWVELKLATLFGGSSDRTANPKAGVLVSRGSAANSLFYMTRRFISAPPPSARAKSPAFHSHLCRRLLAAPVNKFECANVDRDSDPAAALQCVSRRERRAFSTCDDDNAAIAGCSRVDAVVSNRAAGARI